MMDESNRDGMLGISLDVSAQEVLDDTTVMDGSKQGGTPTKSRLANLASRQSLVIDPGAPRAPQPASPKMSRQD